MGHYTLSPMQTDYIYLEKKEKEVVVVDKKDRKCKIIDFAVLGYSRIEDKEKDKTEKYQ